MDLREHFLLSGVFYLTLLPAGFKASQGPAVQPQSWQGFMLTFETKPTPSYLFELQQATKGVQWKILFKGYGWLACVMKNLPFTGFELFLQ